MSPEGRIWAPPDAGAPAEPSGARGRQEGPQEPAEAENAWARALDARWRRDRLW